MLKRAAALVLAVALLAALWTAYALAAIQGTWRSQAAAAPGARADAAVVLGAAAWGERPSPAFAERLDAAADLYRRGRVRGVVLTGGVDAGNPRGLPEAEVGARYLAARGVPRAAMALDPDSTSTAGNLRQAGPLLAARGWRTALLVSHGYHVHRALLQAGDLGLPVLGAIPVQSRVLYMPYHLGREVLALGAYWTWERWRLRGYGAGAVAVFDACLLLGAGAVALTAYGAWLLRRQRRLAPGPVPGGGVSVILPIKGLDPGAAAHYRRWLGQAPGVPYEVIFSLQDPQDPVLPVLQGLLAEHPGAAARIVVNPVRPGLNGKASNLFHGVAVARYPLLVMADSDVFPPPDLLLRLLPPLGDPRVGLVACLPVARAATGFWGRVNALGVNLTLGMQWAPLHQLGLRMGASGACFAIRRPVLAEIGGVAAFGPYVAEDARLGVLVMGHGYRLVLGPAVPLEVGRAGYGAVFSLVSRGAYMARHMFSPGQQVAMGLVTCGHYLVLLGALLARHPLLLGAAGAVILVRWAAAAAFQALTARDGWRAAALAPVLEAVGFVAIIRAFCTDQVRWRGLRYRVRRGGRLELVAGPD